MDGRESLNWFVINSKPKQEFVAQAGLESLGLSVYLPLYKKLVKKDKVKFPVIAPLFGGYLFAQFSLFDHYHKVRYTRGVKVVLGNKEHVWTIGDDKIDDIRSREVNGIVQMRKKQNAFHPGDQVIIDEGDFDGWEGVFQQELPDKERAIILLTNLNFSSKLIIPKKFLIPNS